MEERSAVDKNLTYSISAITPQSGNIIEGMVWLCKTATRNGNEKRQRETATRNGKMQKYIYQAKTLRWEGNRAPQRRREHRENKELQENPDTI
jgi:hypothetical protein